MLPSIQTNAQFALAIILLVSTDQRIWKQCSRRTHVGIAILSALYAGAIFSFVVSPDTSNTNTPLGICLYLAVLMVNFVSMIFATLAFNIALDKVLNPHLLPSEPGGIIKADDPVHQ